MLPAIAMTTLQAAASELGTSAASAPGGAGVSEDFSAVMNRLASQTTSVLREGEASAIGAMQGTVPMQEAVFKIMEAERQLQHALAVRDKLVSAYQEVSRLQI
jgi:flagellar hook-basal body complex protein FliE